MSKFRVGEMARLVATRTGRCSVGTEVTVVTEWPDGAVSADGLDADYSIETSSGERYSCAEWQLEKLAPELGSWSDIAHIWKPEGVAA